MQEKLSFLCELIRCSYPIPLSVYDSAGTLVHTDSESESLQQMFVGTGCLDYAVRFTGKAPLCLSSLLGLLWGAAYTGEGDQRRVYVIGPVLNAELPRKTIEDTARRHLTEPKLRSDFVGFMSELPVVPFPLFQHYMLMLHDCLNGERVSVSEIEYQKSIQQEGAGREKRPFRDRHQTYMAEKQLLYHVREGDMNYRSAQARASSLSTGVRIKAQNPITQALISTTGFTALCTRAAIEGGLSPDTAYTVGDAYIQAMIDCGSVSELGALNHRMYEDFIQRVHKQRQNTALSGPVSECCEYIQLHPEEELSIAVLARLTGYSDYYLSRKFKKEMHMSIHEYIDCVRIERAKMLLETTKESVADIAATLHYCSSTYFSDTFRHITGKLPTEYRKGETQ